MASKSPAKSAFQTVAIAGGTGGVGRAITNAFIESKQYKITVLSRAGDDKKAVVDELSKQGVTVVAVDYSNKQQLVKALTGIDVVVSGLGGDALGDPQVNLLHAAAEAKVRRFIPSEYGCDHTTQDLPLFQAKKALQAEIKKSGLEYTIFYVGFFSDTTFFPWMGVDFAGGKVTVVGDGTAKVSWTHREDVGRYIVASLSSPLGKNAEIRVAGDTLSWNEIIPLAEKAFGKKMEVTHTPLEDVKKQVAAAPNPWAVIAQALQVIYAEGKAEIKHIQNKDFPSVKPVKVADILAQLAKHK